MDHVSIAQRTVVDRQAAHAEGVDFIRQNQEKLQKSEWAAIAERTQCPWHSRKSISQSRFGLTTAMITFSKNIITERERHKLKFKIDSRKLSGDKNEISSIPSAT